MASPPLRDELAGNPTNAEFKLGIGKLWDYVTSLLGNTSTVALDSEKKLARESLGIGSFGFKNRLINPEFLISQQYGVGTGILIAAGAGIVYIVDQWYASASGASISAQQISGISENQYSLRLNGANSNTAFMLGQRIESNNCADLKNKDVTVSLNAKSTSAATITWTAYYANATDVFSSKTVIASGSINLTTTVEKYKFTFNAGSNAKNGIAIEFSGVNLLAGSSVDFDAVQLEKSEVATEFEKRPIQAETLFCKRYCEVLEVGYIAGSVTAAGQNIGSAVNFAVRKFAAPTFTLQYQEQLAFPAGLCTIQRVTTESAFFYKGSSGANTYANWIQIFLVTARL